jgi:hypothetical protein
MERLLSRSDYGIRVKPGHQESPDWKRPGIIECPTHTGQVTIDNRRNPDLATADARLYPLPLTCEPL